MKSKLITTIFDAPEADKAKQFREHLREMLGLDKETREICVGALPKIRQARTVNEEREVINNLCDNSEIPRPVLVHALSVIGLFADALVSDAIPEDDHALWADDLQELSWLDDALRPAFEVLIRQLASLSSDLHFHNRQRRAVGGVLPCFMGMDATVEVRPIRKESFQWGEDVNNYSPEILGTVALASISVHVDVGPVKEFYFQVDDTDIDNIIDSLRAVKKEMSALHQFLKLDRVD